MRQGEGGRGDWGFEYTHVIEKPPCYSTFREGGYRGEKNYKYKEEYTELYIQYNRTVQAGQMRGKCADRLDIPTAT